MPAWVQVGIAAASAIQGARASRNANQDAMDAMQFNPWGGSTPFGNVQFNPDGTYGATLSDQSQQRFDQYSNLFNQFMPNASGMDAYNTNMQQFAGQAGGMAPGLFGNVLGQMGNTPQNFYGDQAMQNLGFGGLGVAGQNAALGGQGLNLAMGQGNQMFNQGQNFLNQQGPAFDPAYANQYIDQQRAFQQPFNENATNSKYQSLFNTGNLGSTGGAEQARNLALSQELADNQIVTAGLGRADNYFGQGLQNAQFNRQLGSGMQQYGSGLQQGAITQAGNLNNTFFNAGNLFGGINSDMNNFNQAISNTQNSRANQALATAMGLFGTGNELQQQAYGNVNTANNAMGMFGQELLQQLNIGGNLGVAGTNAGASMGPYQQGASNAGMWGAASNIDWGSIFSSFGQGNTGGGGGGGGGGTGGSFDGWSDVRLKEDIAHVTTDANGVSWYTWTWNDLAKSMDIVEPEIGVIAQELKQTHPHLVAEDENGYLRVDYRGLQ